MTRKSLSEIEAGDVIEYDYRRKVNELNKNSEPNLPTTYRIVQWNIERGRKLPEIIAMLEACEADIIVLQELDISCSRSGYMNVPKCIAKALQAHVIFVCEFVELDDELRSSVNAVGPLSNKLAINKDKQLWEPTVTNSNLTRSQEEKESSPPPRQLSLEYEEQPTLPPKLQSLYNNGKLRHLHGNATFSRFASLTEPRVIRHDAGLNWNEMGTLIHEPRLGYRCTLRVTVDFPLSSKNFYSKKLQVNEEEEHYSCREIAEKLYIYNCHFEIFCGMLSRVRQLGEVVRDAQSVLKQYKQTCKLRNNLLPLSIKIFPAFVIAGDFNTISHGIVRASRLCAADRMRWLSCGETEACWLQRKVLSRHIEHFTGAVQLCKRANTKKSNIMDYKRKYEHSDISWYRVICYCNQYITSFVTELLRILFHNIGVVYCHMCNNNVIWRIIYGFSVDEISALNNTSLCLYDLSDKYNSITLNNPDYYNLVQGKLDWVLLSNCMVEPLLEIEAPQDHQQQQQQQQHQEEWEEEQEYEKEQKDKLNANSVTVSELISIGSITDPHTINYIKNEMNKCNKNDSISKLNEFEIPRDGYILFNDAYTASDHKGILMCITHGCTTPEECLQFATRQSKASMYTSSRFATGCFVLSRVTFWGLILTGTMYACKGLLNHRETIKSEHK